MHVRGPAHCGTIPRMRWPWTTSIALCLLLAGCGVDRPAASAVPLPQLEQIDGSMEWRGRLPCADCDGIETALRLRHGNAYDDYQLVEVYLSGDDGLRFAETGMWERQGNLIRVRPDDGGSRVYAVMADGHLRPSYDDGQAIRDRDTIRLQPVAPRSRRP